MTPQEFLQLAVFLAALVALGPPMGGYLARVFEGDRTWLSRVLGPIERGVLRLAAVRPAGEMSWTAYAGAVLMFNLAGMLVTLLQLMTQAWLPLNPQQLPNLPFALALNTAVSFMTNTNWQAYSGENTMSHLSQMTGLAVHNFTSAATGNAVAVAVARGLTRRESGTVGNFWIDLVRATVHVLLPLSVVLAGVLVTQGVVQNLRAYDTATVLVPYEVETPRRDGNGRPVTDARGNPVVERRMVTRQTLPQGPAASQVAIKQLGTNGGGFFGVNAAHPFENPTPLSNLLQVLAIFLIPSGLVHMFGRMAGDRRQGWTIWSAMFVLFLAGFAALWWSELQPNPALGLAASLEGKEVRFGPLGTALFATATTDASCGAVNAMHDSLSPLGGLVTLVNMMLGEVVFGGVGAGLYGMLMFVVLTVFLAGLMVGRTPEYLGKKIEASEIRWAVVAVLAPSAVILMGAAVAVSTAAGSGTVNNAGPHGLSEIVYAFTSAAANNGSAFAGLGVNNDFYNYGLAAVMFIGRFAVILPALAIAGGLARKRVSSPGAGTFPTTGFVFPALLVCVIVLVGALTFFPVLSLGPVAEHFLMHAGRTF